MRVKKEREAQIVHFSFFDLLFGAFGAFVFLMILHVIRTMNMVDIDLQKSFDELVQEKKALVVEVQKYKDQEKRRAEVERLYQESLARLKQLEEEKRVLADQNNQYQSRIEALEREVASLAQIQKELMKKGDVQKVLEAENDRLKKSLEEANQKLAGLKTIPLTIKTRAFPPTLTGENVQIAMAAEGGSPPYMWKYSGDLPDGLSFDERSGVITGQAEEDGEFKFNVTVTDARGMSASSPQPLTLQVVKRPIEKEEGVSSWFVVMAVIVSLLLLYILWQKYKAHLYFKRMQQQGYKPMWVRTN